MTDCAAIAGCGGNFQRFRDSLRTRVGENGKGARMKILLRPGEILTAFLARAAVTAGRFATRRADETRAVRPNL